MTNDDLDRHRLVRSLDKLHFTVRDIQDMAGVTERVVLSWINSRQLKAWTAGLELGRKKPRWRVSREAWDEFVRGRTAAPAAPAPIRRQKPQKVGIDFYPQES